MKKAEVSNLKERLGNLQAEWWTAGKGAGDVNVEYVETHYIRTLQKKTARFRDTSQDEEDDLD